MSKPKANPETLKLVSYRLKCRQNLIGNLFLEIDANSELSVLRVTSELINLAINNDIHIPVYLFQQRTKVIMHILPSSIVEYGKNDLTRGFINPKRIDRIMRLKRH